MASSGKGRLSGFKARVPRRIESSGNCALLAFDGGLYDVDFKTVPPDLFLEFSTCSTPESALQFARTWGALGAIQPVPKPDRHELRWAAGVEPLADWLKQANWMRITVGVWEALQAVRRDDGDTVHLEDMIRWPSRDSVEVREGDSWRHLWSEGSSVAALTGTEVSFEYGDLVGPARHYLEDMISRGVQEGTVAVLDWPPGRGRPKIGVRPANLLGALWLQFAEAVTGEKEAGTCAICGRQFLVPPRGRGKGARYCSRRCKWRGSPSYARRQAAKANRTAEEGGTRPSEEV